MSRSPFADIHRMSLLLYAIAFSACSNPTAQQEPTTPTTTIQHVPASIDATGTQDVSASLQAWIDSLPDSTRILGPAGARYRVEFGLLVENRRSIQFDAVDLQNPPRLFQTVLQPYGAGHPDNRNRQVLGFRYGGGHSVRNWILQGGLPNSGFNGQPYDPELEAQHGLLIAGVNGIVVEDVFITEVAGDFIYLTNRWDNPVNTLSRDVIIRRVKGRKCNRQGVAVVGGVNVLIENSDFQDIKRSSFDIEPNSGHGWVQYLTVRNNIFGWFRNNWVAGHGDGDAQVHHISFENNEVIGRPLVFHLRGWRTTSPKPGLRRGHLRVVNNRAHTIDYIATGNLTVMEFSGLDNVEALGNVVEFTGEKPIGVGAYFNETCGITYSGNVWGNAQYDHEVTVAYDASGLPITEYDGANLEWSQCGELVRQSR